MAAMMSVSAMKGKKHTGPPRKDAPKAGASRRLYDFLMERKGRVINMTQEQIGKELDIPLGRVGYRVEYLRNFYGLDIRCFGHGRYILAGEYVGNAYVDYIADELG
jgi:hypothetical protein